MHANNRDTRSLAATECLSIWVSFVERHHGCDTTNPMMQAVGKLLAGTALVVAPPESVSGEDEMVGVTPVAEEIQQLSCSSFPSSITGSSNSSSITAVSKVNKISVALSGAGR